MKKLIWAILMIAGVTELSGQGAKYIIRNYDLLSEINLNGSTWSMVQDDAGLLYFGADFGVAVYNGAFWEIASRDQSIVRSLYLGSGNKIAYGGYDDFGFLEHDISRGIVFNSLADKLPDSLKVFGDIWSISESGRKLFFQSRTRIFVAEQGEITAFRVGDCYHRGFIVSGEFVINQGGIGLTRFTGNSFSLIRGGEFFRDKVISTIIGTSGNRMLVGCRQSGFYLFDPVTGIVDEPFPGYPETNRQLKESQIYHGIILPDGNMAVATLSGGTFVVEPSGRILKILNRNHGLRDNVNYFLGLSRDQNLWICTSNGVSAYNINSPFIFWDYTSGIDGVVLDIIDYQDRIYVGTLTGLYEITGNGNNRDLFRQVARRILKTEVWSLVRMEIDGKQILHFGSGNGLYQMKGSEPVLINRGELILKLIHLKGDPDLLLALHADNMDVYRWNGMAFGFYKKVSNLFNGLRTAALDSNGSLWIGTRNAGVVQIPVDQLLKTPDSREGGSVPNASAGLPRTFSFGTYLTDVIEYQGQAVFSNREGLFSFNYSTGGFERCQLFGPEVASTQKMISTLKKDSRGNIWLGGEDILLARPDGTFTLDRLNFQQLKDVFSAFVFLHTGDQKTWIGGNNGVYLYDNRVVLKLPVRLKAVINRIEVLQDTVFFWNASASGEMRPDSAGAGKEKILEIDLAKRNSQVTFSFSVPFFENERFTEYSYKLDGYDQAWSSWSPVTRVTFSNLKPSEYLFQVKGKTIYNQVSQPAAVRFTVPRPLYLSNYAIVLYIILLSLIIYIVAGYWSRVNLRKHMRIEDVIRKRIQESNRAHILNVLATSPGPRLDQTALAGITEMDTRVHPPVETKEHQFLAHALKIMETHMGNHNLTAGQFCKELGMSQAKVYRKLMSITGMSINEFIRNIRLKKAAQFLIETDHPISEVAYMTGFSSPGYFTKCFTAEFGKNPRDFGHRKHHS